MDCFAVRIFVMVLTVMSAGTTFAEPEIPHRPSEESLILSLSERDLEGVHAQAKEILARCALPDCVIVSLGTTNTLVDAFLRYYLKDKADQAIHYVPIRGIREAVGNLAWMEQIFPSPSLGARRLLLVRTLDSGVSVSMMAEEIIYRFGADNLPYEFSGYFTAGRKYATVRGTLEGIDSWLAGQPFPWPYTLRHLADPNVVNGSYRTIDEYYYRHLIVEPHAPAELWWSEHPIPQVRALRTELARSVGVDESDGPKFLEMNSELQAEWEWAVEHSTGTMEALQMFPARFTGDAKIRFVQRLNQIDDEYVRSIAPNLLRDNPNHNDLDRVVSEFIEHPERFREKQCAARLTGARPILRLGPLWDSE